MAQHPSQYEVNQNADSQGGGGPTADAPADTPADAPADAPAPMAVPMAASNSGMGR